MQHASPAIAAGLFVVASLVAGVLAEASADVRYDSDVASSRVTVKGTSTIHDWTVGGGVIRGELIVHEIEPSSLWTNSESPSRVLTPTPTIRVEIPVSSLKSDKSGLNKKMHEVLKTQAHPLITYRLEAAEIQAGRATSEENVGGSLTVHTSGVLTVAGREKVVDISMQVKRLPEDRLEVSGETSLQMTEFGIEPPTAMLGLLRTGDTIRVRWTWVLARRPIGGRDDR